MPIPENEVWRLGVVTEMKKVINNEWNNSGLSYEEALHLLEYACVS